MVRQKGGYGKHSEKHQETPCANLRPNDNSQIKKEDKEGRPEKHGGSDSWRGVERRQPHYKMQRNEYPSSRRSTRVAGYDQRKRKSRKQINSRNRIVSRHKRERQGADNLHHLDGGKKHGG